MVMEWVRDYFLEFLDLVELDYYASLVRGFRASHPIREIYEVIPHGQHAILDEWLKRSRRNPVSS